MKLVRRSLLIVLCLCGALPAKAAQPFGIQVVDEATGRGVPLVELTTVNNVRYVTDSAGWVAFDDDGLMNQRVFFHIKSHGYEYPADNFGYRGKALDVAPGGEAELKIQRINLAERLYRMTGEGIYRDSVLLGKTAPIDKPLLNAGVLGSDSVVNAVFQGRLHWFWGDTNFPQYPLGNFHVPGATSNLPQDDGLDPARGVDLQYFLNEKQQAKETCRMPGDGPTWIDGLTTLKDANGRERLFAHYVKIRPPLETYESGFCEFDAQAEQFRKTSEFDRDTLRKPGGHPVRVTEDGVDYVCFAAPFPYVRVRAAVDDFLDVSQYEAYTCLLPGDDERHPRVVRDGDGKPLYAWRRDGVPFNHRLTERLIDRQELSPDEVVFLLHDRETGKRIQSHGGSLSWNDYRQRWVMIVLEAAGTSYLGEIWYAEAETPLGPWGEAIKIVTHDNYSFYNPRQHPYFDQDGGRIIYLEGTYTHTFTNNPDQTPRYDYNQIMYRLDLSDKRLGPTTE